MVIFLTGGTGFIGSHFLDKALNAGHSIRALRREGSVPKIPMVLEPNWVQAPLDDVPLDMLRGCDTLVHLAAHGVTDPTQATWRDLFYWNVSASLELWLRAVEAGVKRIIVCGSCFEYGASGERFDFIPVSAVLEPTGPYHSSKAAATVAALGVCVDKQVEVLVVRPFQVYGEGEAPNRFWPSLRKAALSGDDFPMTSGLQVRDFINVEVVAAHFMAAVTRNDLHPGLPIIENLGTGRPRSLAQFAEDEWKNFGGLGKVILGAVPMRPNEVMRFVPEMLR